jgi:hypothetical protein
MELPRFVIRPPRTVISPDHLVLHEAASQFDGDPA